jgi:hypothetical protein
VIVAGGAHLERAISALFVWPVNIRCKPRIAMAVSILLSHEYLLHILQTEMFNMERRN